MGLYGKLYFMDVHKIREFMERRNSATRGLRRICVAAVITLLGQPGAGAHPFRGMMDAHNAVYHGVLAGETYLGELEAWRTFRGIEDAAKTAVCLYDPHSNTSPEIALKDYQEHGAKAQCDGRPASLNYVELVSRLLYWMLVKHERARIALWEAEKEKELQERLAQCVDLYHFRIRQAHEQKLRAGRRLDQGRLEKLSTIHEARNWHRLMGIDESHDERKDVQLYIDGLELRPIFDMAFEVGQCFMAQRHGMLLNAPCGAGEMQSRDDGYVMPWVANKWIGERLRECRTTNGESSDWLLAALMPVLAQPEVPCALFQGRQLRPCDGTPSSEMLNGAVTTLMARILVSKDQNPDITPQIAALKMALESVCSELESIVDTGREAMHLDLGQSRADVYRDRAAPESDIQYASSTLEVMERAVKEHDAAAAYLVIRDVLHTGWKWKLKECYAGNDDDSETLEDARVTRNEDEGDTTDDKEVSYVADGEDTGAGEVYGSAGWLAAYQRIDEDEAAADAAKDENIGQDAWRDDLKVALNLNNEYEAIIGAWGRSGWRKGTADKQILMHPDVPADGDMMASINNGTIDRASADADTAKERQRHYTSLPAEPAFTIREETRKSGRSHSGSAPVTIARAFYEGNTDGFRLGECDGEYKNWRLWMMMRHNADSGRYEVQAMEEEPAGDAPRRQMLSVPVMDDGGNKAVLAIYRRHEPGAYRRHILEADWKRWQAAHT
jgi:hypothetical protein